MINEELIAINASHAIYMNRLASGLGNKVAPYIDTISEAVEARINKEVGRNLTTARREKLLEDIAEIVSSNLKEYTSFLNAENKEMGGYEASFQATAVNSLLVNAETTTVTAAAVNKTAKATLISYGNGTYSTYTEMMRKYWADNATQITNIVANGFQSGTSTREVANSVMSEVGTRLGKTKKSALTLARTGLNHYANTARRDYFEVNSVIVGTRRIATIDSQTSPFCRSIDQTVVMKTDANYRNAFGPFHYGGCRTANVPEIDARYTQDDDGGDRATNFKVDGSLDPKPVDSRNIYYQEMSNLSAVNQDGILGPTLGKAFRKLLRDGGTPAEFAKLTINESLNKAYTITELKQQDNVLTKMLKDQAV